MPTSLQDVGKTERAAWEIVIRITDPRSPIGAAVRTTMLVVADSFEQVLEYLKADRADLRSSVETIHKLGPVVAIITEPKQTHVETTPPRQEQGPTQ